MAASTPTAPPVHERRVALTRDEDLVDAFIYCLRCPANVQRYVGMTTNYQARMARHRAMVGDGVASPLHRYVAENHHGSMEGWTMELLAHVWYDAQRLPLAAKECEQQWIDALREHDAPLLNVNSAYDRKEARREYMRAWRIAHGQGGPPGTSYMSQKGREARERRHVAMEVGGGV
eukprot:COSAG06_NODE_650_length_13391_cov_5.990445_1_plen_176_part_00